MSGGEFLGRMRERVTLERRMGLPDGLGGVTSDWQPVAHVWAALEAVSLPENQIGGRLANPVRYQVVLRSLPDLSLAWRLKWRNRRLTIHGVDRVAGRSDLVLLTAYEERGQ